MLGIGRPANLALLRTQKDWRTIAPLRFGRSPVDFDKMSVIDTWATTQLGPCLVWTLERKLIVSRSNKPEVNDSHENMGPRYRRADSPALYRLFGPSILVRSRRSSSATGQRPNKDFLVVCAPRGR